MRNSIRLLLFMLFIGTALSAQVKIGDNPESIDPSSVLELESTDKVLVITRVTTAQMNAIVPSQGALCYNIDLQSVHYYDGTQWVNIGGSGGGPNGTLTDDPIVNRFSTIEITPTATGNNFEVRQGSISTEHIANSGITGEDIADGSIVGSDELRDGSVTGDKLSENSVGAFALDNENFGVSAFNNDAGYITSGDLGNVVSDDSGNAISLGSTGGAFYDDSNLLSDIMDNEAAIAAHNTADTDLSPTNERQNLLFNSATNILTLTTPATAGNQVNLSSLAGAGGSDDQNLEKPTLSAANILTLNIESGDPTTIDLSPLAGGGSTEVIDGTTLTGLGTVVDPFKIEPGASGQVLTTSAAGVVWANAVPGGGSTEEADQTTITGVGTNADPFKIEPGTTGQFLTTDATGVVWSTVSPGGGTTEVIDDVTLTGVGTAIDPFKVKPGAASQILRTTADGLDVTWVDLPLGGADGSETIIDATASTVAVTGTGTTLDPYVLTATAGDGSETIIDATASTVGVTGTGTTLDPYVLTATAGDGSETIIDATASTVAVTGTGTTLDPYVLTATAGDGSETIIDATASTVAVTGTGTTLDPYVLTATAGDGSETIIDATASTVAVTGTGTTLNPYILAEHTGTTNEIFFADATTGAPTSTNGLIWNPEAINGAFPALGIGLDGVGVQSAKAKVHIMENYPLASDPISYGLQLQNRSQTNNTATGMIFSVDDWTTSYGKGALVFERTGSWAVGDFHFLQNNATGAGTDVNPTLADKAFTITSDKNIKLYGNLVDKNDIGAIPPASGSTQDGYVLTNTTGGTVWAAPGGIGSLNQNNILLGDAASTPQKVALNTVPLSTLGAADADVAMGGFKITNLAVPTLDQDAATKKYVDDNGGHSGTAEGSVFFSGAGPNFAPTDNNAQLYWDNTNNRLGIGTNTPTNKFHVTGAVRSEGILNSDGDVGEPSYRFNGDTNTGMFLRAADDIGFTVGGDEAMSIIKPTPTAETKVIVNENLELSNALLDKDGDAGTAGQVLSSTGGANPQTDWITPSPRIRGVGKIAADASQITFTSGFGQNLDPNPGSYQVAIGSGFVTNANYIVQLTVEGDFIIYVENQTISTFDVKIKTRAGVLTDAVWHYTVLEN